jgi:hypothetical protein
MKDHASERLPLRGRTRFVQVVHDRSWNKNWVDQTVRIGRLRHQSLSQRHMTEQPQALFI